MKKFPLYFSLSVVQIFTFFFNTSTFLGKIEEKFCKIFTFWEKICNFGGQQVQKSALFGLKFSPTLILPPLLEFSRIFTYVLDTIKLSDKICYHFD